jgi:phage repressor protein C with HTH and peptisase S24 domain
MGEMNRVATKNYYSEQEILQITERIEQLRLRMELSKSDFCGRIGFPLKTYLNVAGPRRSKPSAELLAAVAAHVDVNLRWLLTGQEAGPGKEGATVEVGGEPLVLIPFYDVQASAGSGSLVQQERLRGRLAFRADWVYGELKVAPKSLALITATGDSMQPTVGHGDLLLLNIHETHVTGDAIYALQMQDVLLIKRVQLLVDGTLVIRSDNPAYGEQRVRREEGVAPRIVGRVVWIAKRM